MLHQQKLILQISEIFSSLQGESYLAGLPCVFVRLTGCHLRCKYCDTKRAYRGGKQISIPQIIRRIRHISPIRRICLTGGEPLLQENVYPLMKVLLKKKYQVSLETSGTLDISRVPRAIVKVMDIKTPGSVGANPCLPAMEGIRPSRTTIDNLKFLLPHDEVKFVVTDQRDIDWSLKIIKKHKINKICHVSLSPVNRRLAPMIAKAMLRSRLNVRLQLQLHKLIGLR